MIMEVKDGDMVLVHYTGKHDNIIFDTTLGKKPFLFTLGEGSVIESFENEIIGMKKGQQKTVFIEKAYGERDERFITEVSKEKLGDLGIEFKPGIRFELRDKMGMKCITTIHQVKKNSIVFDLNHPLAGKDLQFDIELLDIQRKKSFLSGRK